MTKSDVDLAVSSNGIIFGFNTEAPDVVDTYAKQKSIQVASYDIIYELIDEVTAAMEGLLASVVEREPIGQAEVKAIFGSGKSRVAGCLLIDGLFEKGCYVEVKRKKDIM